MKNTYIAPDGRILGELRAHDRSETIDAFAPVNARGRDENRRPQAAMSAPTPTANKRRNETRDLLDVEAVIDGNGDLVDPDFELPRHRHLGQRERHERPLPVGLRARRFFQ